MNKTTQEGYIERVQNPTELRALTVKEAELLGNLLNTEPMVRALTIICWQATQISQEFRNVDFSDSAQCHVASKAQGQIIGAFNTVEALLQLTEVPTDEDDEESGEPDHE